MGETERGGKGQMGEGEGGQGALAAWVSLARVVFIRVLDALGSKGLQQVDKLIDAVHMGIWQVLLVSDLEPRSP